MDEPRWPVLLPLSFVLGMILAGMPQWSVLPFPDSLLHPRIDWLFALALATAWPCRDEAVPGIMGWCGLMYDLFLGGRLGGHVVLFMLAGIFLLAWRREGVRQHRWGMRWLAGLSLAAGVGLLRPLAQSPSFWVAYAPAEIIPALATALWTATIVPLLEALMAGTGFFTWRKGGLY